MSAKELMATHARGLALPPRGLVFDEARQVVRALPDAELARRSIDIARRELVRKRARSPGPQSPEDLAEGILLRRWKAIYHDEHERREEVERRKAEFREVLAETRPAVAPGPKERRQDDEGAIKAAWARTRDLIGGSDTDLSEATGIPRSTIARVVKVMDERGDQMAKEHLRVKKERKDRLRRSKQRGKRAERDKAQQAEINGETPERKPRVPKTADDEEEKRLEAEADEILRRAAHELPNRRNGQHAPLTRGT